MKLSSKNHHLNVLRPVARIFLATTVITGIGWGLFAYYSQTAHGITETFTVTTDADSGAGSLRQAIIDSNATPSTAASPNAIVFAIPNADPGNPTVHTISLASALPTINHPVRIDGTSQQGSSCGTLVPTDGSGVIQENNTPHRLMVEVTSSAIPDGQNSKVINVDILANGTQIRGLVMGGARNNYIISSAAPLTSVECNYIGTNASGDSLATNGGSDWAAIYLEPSANTSVAANNLIAAIRGGIVLGGTGSSAENNIVGLDHTGRTVLPQVFTQESRGIYANSSANLSISHNVVGGYDNAINGYGADGLEIKGNFLGINIDGTTSNIGTFQRWGIRGLGNSHGVVIGGSSAADRNLMIGTEFGIRTEGPTNIQILGNYFGLNKNGTSKPVGANFRGGVAINGAHGVLIKNNTIVNSSGSGIEYGDQFYNSSTGVYGCEDVTIDGNYIGVTANGMSMPNDVGIMSGCNETVVKENVIANNSSDGIRVDGFSNVTTSILGNIIGLSPDGVSVAPNGARGILVARPGKVIIGGTQPSERNIISGNKQDQILINADDPNNMRVIQGNYICLNKNGDQATVSSGGFGLNFQSAGNITVGGDGTGEGNVIACDSGNILQDFATNSPIYYYGNIIGLKPDGETPASTGEVTPGQFSIFLRGSSNTYFGGAQPGQGNIIGANPQYWGFAFTGWEDGSRTVRVQGNKYGVTKSGQPAGNKGPIQVAHIGGTSLKGLIIGGDTEADGNDIANTISSGLADNYGASSIGDGLVIGASDGAVIKHNRIWGNARNGITLYGDTGGNSMIENNTIHDNKGLGVGVSIGYDQGTGSLGQVGNTIRFNAIYKNDLQGIDLGTSTPGSPAGSFDGVTANDLRDTDTGPNMLQNYPVIKYQLTSCDGTKAEANGGFNSTPNTTFIIDYYTNPSWNEGQPLQGEQWHSSETVTTDASGDAVFHLPSGLTNPTMTATDPSGNTSEFGAVSSMGVSNCTDMSQITLGSTTSDFDLQAGWDSTLPASYDRSEWVWDAGSSNWEPQPKKVGLLVKITVDDRPFIFDSPKYLGDDYSAYELNAYGWQASGHLATRLPEGVYDVTLTVTDPATGFVMTNVYANAVKVALPKINYTTTITNNQTPTLNGEAADVRNLYSAYIVSAGTAIDEDNPPKSRALVYVADRDANGNQLTTGKWQIITNKDELIASVTARIAASKSKDLEYYASGAWARSLASNYFADINGVVVTDTTGLSDLQNYCSILGVRQRIQGWWGVTITDEQTCRDWFQQLYDAEYNYRVQYWDNALQSQLDDINSDDPAYDMTSLVEGTYDIYIVGADNSYESFMHGLPGGLVIDLSQPAATMTTERSYNSPALRGLVSDPTAKVKVMIMGQSYMATNRGDGTWYITAGIIASLAAGEYDVTVEVTNLAGTTTTTTSKLLVQNTPEQTGGSASVDQSPLAATGQSVVLLAIGAFVALGVAGVLLWRLARKKH